MGAAKLQQKFSNTGSTPDLARGLWFAEPLDLPVNISRAYPSAGKGDFTFIEEYKGLKCNVK